MKTVGDKSIKNFLVDFGLTEKEIIVYLTLLKSGPNTIMNLARETSIKRSTTHNTVEELIKKGLVSQTNYGERRMVIAEDPEKLNFLMDQKKWDINKLEKNLPDVVKSIYEVVPQVKENTKIEVRYYQGEKGFKEASQRSLDYAEGEILSIVNMKEWVKVYSQEYDKDHYLPTRLKKNLPLRVLTVKDNDHGEMLKNNKEQKRTTKFLNSSLLFNSTIFIYGSEVSIMVSSEPYTSIIMENKEIHHTFRAIFENLWLCAQD